MRALACASLLLAFGCHSHGTGPDGSMADGDMFGGLIDGASNDLDLDFGPPPPDLTPLPDLGGTDDPNWIDPTGTRDLTAEGTIDWVHWGLANQNSVDRMAGVTPAIMASIVGTGVLHQYNDNHVAFTWSNGTPTVASTGTPNAVLILGAGNGFKITVPAEHTLHTLRVYLSAFDSDFKLTAHLSDGSAYDYVDTEVNPTGVGWLYRMYTFNYKSLNPGQTFEVTWVDTRDRQGGGNVTLQAATLQ